MLRKSFLSNTITIATALVLMVLLPGSLFGATTGKIAGKVTDAGTGDPLPGANVVVEGTMMGAATDEAGDYFIINIPPGRYNVTVTMIGYQPMTMSGALVSTNHTTPLNYQLTQTALELEAVTVTAEREVIKMDESSSIITVESADIINVPTVTNIEDFLNQMEGVEDMVIRGGGLDQTELQMDGMMIVNQAQNRPMPGLLNLSAVQELSIIKGGFSAEYGNVRSGVISVITKSGSPSAYHGSVDFRYAPPQMKHAGRALYDTMNWYLRPYFDPDVAFVGTAVGWAGDENKELRETYPEWEGWNSWVERQAEAGINQTPVEAQNTFRWYHRADGADRIGHPRGVAKYGEQPDWVGDFSFSGPVPVVSRMLGDMTFFASYKNQGDAWSLPMPKATDRLDYDGMLLENAHLKLSTNISRSMKLKVEGLYSEIKTVRGAGGTGGQAGGAAGMFLSEGGLSIYQGRFGPASRGVFYDYQILPINVYRGMQGLTFDHVLSPRTHYSIRLSNIRVNFKSDMDLVVKRKLYDDIHHEDTKHNIVKYFGDVAVDESPYGYSGQGYVYMWGDNQVRALGAGARDWTSVNTFQVKFDITSQVDKYNQLKAGFLYNYDDINTHFANMSEFDITGNFDMKWHQFPYRMGAYVRDKIEFEGMIADLGLRVDINEPNADWFTQDRYSKYFTKKYRENFAEEMKAAGLVEPAKGNVKISPRLGISHPISEVSKLYFNYGHFYSMAPSTDMYTIRPGAPGQGITFLGNPSADMPRTISYELGYEHDISEMFLLRLAGYYKDVSSQTGEVNYISWDEAVDYETIENNHYADVRGFEIRFEKRFGRWFSGWANYDYRVETEGYVGREVYYEDQRMQLLYGLMNPYQERPLARPIARANIRFTTPYDWGPVVAGMHPISGVNLSLLWRWKAGRYETWDPLSTYELKDNVQWKGEHDMDLRLEKRSSVAGINLSVFMDIVNLFDLRYISTRGFGVGNDYRFYMGSLHLKMYDDPEYQAANLPTDGYTGDEWKDRPGDRKTKDKDYINMPDRKFLTYLNPRRITLGIKLDF